VGEHAPGELDTPLGPYRNRPAGGLARIVCYHPRHDLSLPRLTQDGVVQLLETWKTQYLEIGAREGVNHVLIFENRGEAVGVSNPHPHCQIYGTNFIFKTIENEARFTSEHYNSTGRTLLEDMVAAEIEDGRRVVAERETALAFIPYCARWAYEAFVTPIRPCTSIAELTDAELEDFASVLRELVIRFDNLWKMPFPYVMVLHNAPTDGGDYRGFHFHVEFHPPLRKPNLLKHLAGPEIGGGSFLSDTWPEDKAAELQSLSPIHYAEQ
jgi:UDPglucose--hexose-1-phosphate uridylyltransferase